MTRFCRAKKSSIDSLNKKQNIDAKHAYGSNKKRTSLKTLHKAKLKTGPSFVTLTQKEKRPRWL